MKLPTATGSDPMQVLTYGNGIFGRPIECFLIDGDYYLYGVTEHGDVRVLPSLGMAREVAASALPALHRAR
jgi:hypothetical protein